MYSNNLLYLPYLVLIIVLYNAKQVKDLSEYLKDFFRATNYFYNIKAERARELLFLYGTKGEFLVRPSESNPTDHTLSVQ